MSTESPVRFRGTLASRVSLLATFAVGFSVVLGSFAAYASVRHQLYASLDDSLLQRASAAAALPELSGMDEQDVPPWMLGAADIRIAVLDSTGEVLLSTRRTGESTIELGRAELEVALGRADHTTRSVPTSDGRYRVAAVPGPEPGTALILAQSLRPTYDALERLSLVLALFGLLGIVGAALLGWQVARNGLLPVRRLTQRAEEIARTEQLRPIDVSGQDEVARLAMAFNSMLTALAASRDRQRQLVADASHELRTPLTSLRTNLDLLTQAEAQGGLPPQARRELMEDLSFQIDELTTLIGDLTELARDEPVQIMLEPLDLAEVVDRAVDRVRRRATGLEFDVRLSPWWVQGDANVLERAVTNLLDNAAKWSPPQGRVGVRLEDGHLEVTDQGPGISQEDLPHIFERFYRSAESRTMPGSGLGLAIVAKAAETHAGGVCAGQAPGGGAAFWFSLPGTPRPAGSRATSPSPLPAPSQ